MRILLAASFVYGNKYDLIATDKDCDAWSFEEVQTDSVENCYTVCQAHREICDYFSFYDSNVFGYAEQAYCYLYVAADCSSIIEGNFQGAKLYKINDVESATTVVKDPLVINEWSQSASGLVRTDTQAPAETITDITKELCPSTECWSYDVEKLKCVLNPICTKITCTGTSMLMEFSKDVFGVDDGAEIIPSIKSDYDGDKDFAVECPLGTCGMLPNVDNNYLVFRVVVGTGDPETAVELGGGLVINTNSNQAELEFECRYAMEVKVTGVEFNIEKVKISGVNVGVGNLADGFDLETNIMDGKIHLGSMMEVTTIWQVTTLENVRFYYKNCHVSQGASKVNIVEEGCFAEALGCAASEDNQEYGIEQAFKFRTFTIHGEHNYEQRITCILGLCVKDNDCTAPVTSEDCPNEAPYYYKL